MSDLPIRKVLFISADQWRAECLSGIGHPAVKTPHLDQLAREGVLFRRHYAQASPCGPSRTSMLTGMYLMNHRSGRNGTPLDSRHTNIALEVRKAGYDPTLFGYTDTTPDPRRHAPDDPVLRTYEGVLPGMTVGLQLPDHMAPWIADLKAKGYQFRDRWDVYKPKADFARPLGRGHSYAPTLFSAEDSETTFVANAVLRWLSVRRDEPWFVHAVFLRPHPPIIAPEPYNALYDPAKLSMAVRAKSVDEEGRQHPFLKLALESLRERGAFDEHYPYDLLEIGETEVRQLRATYYGMMTQVDDQIGRLMAHLKATGEDRHTLVIFTCDHAEMLGDHWLWGKTSYFDQAYHIPLIIRDPRRLADGTRGQQVDRFTEAVDIMSTILEWLGRDIPHQCDGRSLLSLLEGEPPAQWRQEAHYEFDFQDVVHQIPETTFGISSDQCSLAVLRGRRFKYVHFAALPPLLFDLEKDPFEQKNLAGDPAYAGEMLACAQKMLSWRMEHAEHVLSRAFVSERGVSELPARRR
jgi:arylsulfatase A-like enzyme